LHLLLRGEEKDPAAGKEDEAPHLRRDDDTGGAQIRFETCVLIVKNKLFFFFFSLSPSPCAAPQKMRSILLSRTSSSSSTRNATQRNAHTRFWERAASRSQKKVSRFVGEKRV